MNTTDPLTASSLQRSDTSAIEGRADGRLPSLWGGRGRSGEIAACIHLGPDAFQPLDYLGVGDAARKMAVSAIAIF